MHSVARSAISTLTSVLKAHGFQAHVESRRADNRRLGYTARFMSRGIKPGLFIFDYCAPGEFARICAVLQAEGYKLEDAKGGDNFIKYGCARVTKPAA